MKPEQLTDEQRQLLGPDAGRYAPAADPADRSAVERTNAGPAPANASAPAFSAATAAGAAATVGADSGADRATAAAARVQQPKPVQQQQPKQTASNQQPYQDLLQTPAHTNTTQPRAQGRGAGNSGVEEAPKTTAEKRKTIAAG